MYKIMNGAAPSSLRDLFTPINASSDYNLRWSDINVKLPNPRSEYLKRTLAYSGAAKWNSLPKNIKGLMI